MDTLLYNLPAIYAYGVVPAFLLLFWFFSARPGPNPVIPNTLNRPRPIDDILVSSIVGALLWPVVAVLVLVICGVCYILLLPADAKKPHEYLPERNLP